jgi:hypothetical protein
MNRAALHRGTLLLASVLVLSLIVSFGWGSKGRAVTRTSWEYKVIRVSSSSNLFLVNPEQELNSIGVEGWELAYVIHDDGQVSRLCGTWVFKRAK